MKKYLVFIIIMSALNAYAQGDIEKENITIIKSFEPVLIDAERPNLSPSGIAPDMSSNTNTNLTIYQIPPRLLATEFDAPQIKPLAYKIVEDDWQYRYFIKAGYGNLQTPYLDVSASTRSSKKFSGGLHGFFTQSNGKDLPFQKFRNIDANAFGKWFRPKVYWGVNLDYENEKYHYYGIDPFEVPDDGEKIALTYNTGRASIDLGNLRNDYYSFDHETKLTYQYCENNYGAQEHNINFATKLIKTFGTGFGLGTDTWFDYTNFTNQEDYRDPLQNSLLNFTPYLQYSRPWGLFKAGANLLLDGQEFTPKPYLYTELHVWERKMSLFAGWETQAFKNNLYNLHQENPYLAQDINFVNSFKTAIYGGIKGNISNNFTYALTAGKYDTKQQAMFVTDYLDERNPFVIIYDSLKAITTKLEITYHFDKPYSVRFIGQYSDFETTTEEKPWHIPNLDIGFNIKIAPFARFETGLDLFLIDGLYAKAANGESIALDPVPDLSIDLAYAIKHNWSVFAETHNLLNKKYQRYLNYPSYGINFLVGTIVKF
ncbi:MAG: hypothetical protein R2798_01000 [Chitinophagales bacterium]|nr:hypothetical protein [Bacteroidota bacterium]